MSAVNIRAAEEVGCVKQRYSACAMISDCISGLPSCINKFEVFKNFIRCSETWKNPGSSDVFDVFIDGKFVKQRPQPLQLNSRKYAELRGWLAHQVAFGKLEGCKDINLEGAFNSVITPDDRCYLDKGSVDLSGCIFWLAVIKKQIHDELEVRAGRGLCKSFFSMRGQAQYAELRTWLFGLNPANCGGPDWGSGSGMKAPHKDWQQEYLAGKQRLPGLRERAEKLCDRKGLAAKSFGRSVIQEATLRMAEENAMAAAAAVVVAAAAWDAIWSIEDTFLESARCNGRLQEARLDSAAYWDDWLLRQVARISTASLMKNGHVSKRL